MGQLALLLVLPLLHLSVVKRRNFVQRILTAVKVNATRKRINARNNLDSSCYLIDMLAFKILNIKIYYISSIQLCTIISCEAQSRDRLETVSRGLVLQTISAIPSRPFPSRFSWWFVAIAHSET